MLVNYRLLEVFAHPDDESYGTGGTLAKYAAQGAETFVVSATRGEAGEIRDTSAATRENLGEVRESELRAAAAVLGVSRVYFLDYIDGELGKADPTEVEEKIVRLIRQIRPHILVTFGPDGIYGHPDHVAIHRFARAAYFSAGDPSKFPEHLHQGLRPFTPLKLYYSEFPKSKARLMSRTFASLGLLLDAEWYNPAHFGVDDDLITTTVDVSTYLGQKEAALRIHRTQTGVGGPYGPLPENLHNQLASFETYMLAEIAPGVKFAVDGDDLFSGIVLEPPLAEPQHPSGPQP